MGLSTQLQLQEKEEARLRQINQDNPWEWLRDVEDYRRDGPAYRRKPKLFVTLELMDFDRTSFDGVWEDIKGGVFTITGRGLEAGSESLEKEGCETKLLALRDGSCSALEVREGRRCELQDERFEVRDGQLIAVGSRIRWNDGTIWFRKLVPEPIPTPQKQLSNSPAEALKKAPSSQQAALSTEPRPQPAAAIEAPKTAPAAAQVLVPSCLEVEVLDQIRGKSLKVSVRVAATFWDVKEAVAEELGDADWPDRARLAGKKDGVLFRYKDDQAVLDVRQVFVVGAKLS